MQDVLSLPYICPLGGIEVSINLEETTLFARTWNKGDGSRDAIRLMEDCAHFSAAPGKDGILHILAADRGSRLHYYLLSGEKIRDFPFIVDEARSFFTIAFSENGHGFYVSREEKGKVTAALFSVQKGWTLGQYAFGRDSTPVSLIFDQFQRAHLLAIDQPGPSLWYVALPTRAGGRVQLSTELDTCVSPRVYPAFSLDPEKNIHTAWVSGLDSTLRYRHYSAGGWPSGGWQPEQVVAVEKTPQFISFYRTRNGTRLWLQSTDGDVIWYDPATGDTGTFNNLPQSFCPVRVGRCGSTELTLAGKNTDGFYTPFTLEQGEKEREESPFLEHAYQVMAEKKQLMEELAKSEQALNNLRQELSITAELEHKLAEQNKTLAHLQQALAQKSDYLEVKRREAQNLKEQVTQLETKVGHLHKSCENQYQTINHLQHELAKARDREQNYFHKIQELKRQLEEKRGLWDSVKKVFRGRRHKG